MDGPPPQEEDFTTLSIEDRLSHKNWKARVSGYEALNKAFQLTISDTDPAFKPYINNPDLLKKAVTDSNAVAQEKGVECVVAFVKFAGETAAQTREAIVPALVDKCLGSTRAGTKSQAIELILQYVEAGNEGAGVVDNILPGLGAKQPKAVAGSVTALKEIIQQFGTHVTPPGPILKALPKIFGHTDKNVRAEGTNLSHALYQFLGSGIEPWLQDLKPVQVKELKEAWESMEKDGKGRGSLKPTRMTRKHAREVEESAAAGEQDAIAEEDLTPPDPRQFAEAVDIIPKLPPNLQACLTSTKWKERKEVLDDLLALLNATPHIKEAPEFGDLSKSLASRVQSDANINCVMVAAQCIEALAKGLMDGFARYRESVIPPMLERLKERKASVTDTIGVALDAVFDTTSLTDVIGDLLPALNHKNPQVKEGTLKFFARCLSTSSQAIPPAQIKPVSESLAALLEDSFAGARDEAAIALGTLMKMVGERPLGPVMDSLADVRKVKVKEAFENATVKAKPGVNGPSRSAPPPAAASKAPPKKAPAPKKPEPTELSPPPPSAIPDELSPPVPPKKGPAGRLLARKPAAAASTPGSAAVATASNPAVKKPPVAAAAAAAAAATASKGGKQPPGATPGALDNFKYKHTPEDAESLAAELFPSNFAIDLADANWKTRLAALDEMTAWVENNAESLDAEVTVRFLGKKGWSEKNFQVSAKLFNVLLILAEKSPSFGRSCVALSVPHLTEKLGDAKLKKPAGDAMVAFAEKTSLQFVLNQAYDALEKIKAPKALADALGWIDLALAEFGISGLSLRALIECLKAALKNSNAAVRTSATKTLITVKLFAGAGIKDLLQDLNPQLLATIEKEFEKVDSQSPPEPVRTSADVAAMASAGTSSGSRSAAPADALDDLFPRVDLDGLLKGTTILADAKSEAWKTKKEALETLQAILDQGANKRLKPNIGEIAQVLKARVIDANKAVQSLALDVVARIATGMGKPFEKQTKFFVAPVATVLADQKAPTRAAGLQTLTAIVNACESMEPLVHGLAASLEASNPMQRATLLGWLVEWFKDHEIPPSLDLGSWTAPIVGCLDDRNGDVRKGSQGMLPYLIASVGFEKVLQQSSSLKPASKASAMPLINAARTLVPVSTSAGATATVPAAESTKAALPVKTTAPPLTSTRVTAGVRAVSPPPPPSPTAASAPAKSVTKSIGVRRRIPQGSVPQQAEARSEHAEDLPAVVPRLPGKAGPSFTSGLKRPGTSAPSVPKQSPPPAPSPPAAANSPILASTNINAKSSRLAKDGVRWINEAGTTRKDLADLLQHQMEPHASQSLIAKLFSHDHNAVNDHIAGLTMLCELYAELQAGGDIYGLSQDEAQAVGLANSDFALKYVSMKAHEPQSNLVARCMDVIDTVLVFLQSVDYQLSDLEASCFVPTLVYKLGDARENIRSRVQSIFALLPKTYPYSRIFQILLDHGLKSKVAKTRQFSLDELERILKRAGISACEPTRACPLVAAMIADKDPNVRKSALAVLSEVYAVEGEKIWSLVGSLTPKDKTQLEERLRRVAGPSTPSTPKSTVVPSIPPTQALRLTSGIGRPASPSGLPTRGIPRPASPAVSATSRLTRPTSPRSIPISSGIARPAGSTHLPGPTSPSARGKSMLPSRLAPPKSRMASQVERATPTSEAELFGRAVHVDIPPPSAGHIESWRRQGATEEADISPVDASSDITSTITNVLSNDSDQSVDALKKIQKILQLGPDAGPSSSEYQELAEHAEGLIETITVQIRQAFDSPERQIRLAKHLIQTLNAFCDNPLLAETLTVDIFTSLLEELATRLLQTDDSQDQEVKNLSRFINMIMLRLFSTGRRITIFRALFALLLQIVRPFPSQGTLPESKEARVAELVLKCIWKLARNIPQDLADLKLDPIELFPAVEHFLQTIPPNEWRARSANRVPCGDMPLRTVKVIIQHVVAHYGEEAYDLLSASFDDPSATIVYPYVYRILNSAPKAENGNAHRRNGSTREAVRSPSPQPASRAESPTGTASVVSTGSGDVRRASPSHRTSRSRTSINGLVSPPTEEPDPDAQLNDIINHISSETTGAMHKEGITELHHFLKQYPHKKAKVDKLLERTGPAFRKYISRALASRAAEDEERDAAVADTLSKLESNPAASYSPARLEHDLPRSPISSTFTNGSDHSGALSADERQDKLNRLHNIFQYRTSTSSQGRATPTPSLGSVRPSS